MIAQKTLLIIIVFICITLVSIVIALGILKQRKYIMAQLQLVFALVILLVFTVTVTNCDVSSYKNGIEIKNVINVDLVDNEYYKIKLTDGQIYKTEYILEGEETKLITNAKLVMNTPFGFKMYKVGDVILVKLKDVDYENMSISEKKALLNN